MQIVYSCTLGKRKGNDLVACVKKRPRVVANVEFTPRKWRLLVWTGIPNPLSRSLVKYRLPNWIRIIGFTPSLALRSSTRIFR